MLKRSLWVALLVSATIAPGMAQDNSKQDLTVSVSGNFTHTSKPGGLTHKVEPTAGMLVSYRYMIAGPSGVQVDFGVERETQYYTHGILPNYPGTTEQATQAKVKQYDYTLSYVYKFNSKHLMSGKLHPYALGGAGFMTFSPAGGASGSATSKVEYVFGGGIETRLNAKAFFRVQYRGQMYRIPGLARNFGVPNLSPTGWAYVSQPSLGIGFHF